jgi:hypothetical protein
MPPPDEVEPDDVEVSAELSPELSPLEDDSESPTAHPTKAVNATPSAMRVGTSS